ncbi:MAG: hypothetical protein ACXVCP_04585 [Bdellovibrio sp.]
MNYFKKTLLVMMTLFSNANADPAFVPVDNGRILPDGNGRILPEGPKEIPNYCLEGQPWRSVTVQGAPNYFYKLHPDRDLLFYATDNGSLVYDLDTKQYRPIPSDQDVVPLGSDLVVTPHFQSSYETTGLEFYSVKEIMGQKATFPKKPYKSNIRPIFIDKKMTGMYPTTGQIQKNQFRVLVDDGYLKVRDYEVSNKDINAIGESQHLCKGEATTLKMPMLSKNGEFLAALDIKTATTKIFQLKKSDSDGSIICNLVHDLKISVSKADFSFDNSKLVFHKETSGPTEQFFASPLMENNGHMLGILDLKTKNFSWVPTGMANGHAWYPVFKKNGDILTEVVTPIKGTDSGRKSQFAIFAQPKSQSRTVKSDCSNRNDQLTMAIGALKMTVCKDWQTGNTDNGYLGRATPHKEILLNPQMSKNQCIEVIKDFWEQYKQQISKVVSYSVKNSGNKNTSTNNVDFSSTDKNELLHLCNTFE